MMSAILAEGLENKEFIEKRTAGFDELRAALSAVPPERAAEITGVAADKIREAAIAYAKAEKGCILYDVFRPCSRRSRVYSGCRISCSATDRAAPTRAVSGSPVTWAFCWTSPRSAAQRAG